MDIQNNAKLSKPKIISTYNKKQEYWYVYSDQSYWDPKKKQTRHIRHTIGKRLTKDGDIIYNNRFKAEHAAQALMQTEISTTELMGETLVLDSIVRELGLHKHLVAAFGKISADRITGLAEYIICTKRAPSWSGDWAAYRNPKIESMSSQIVSELLCSLNRDKRNTFFRSWMEANRCRKGYFCFDSTNIGGYNTETNPLVEYGYTHGHISLPQVNVAILSRQDTLVPIHSVVYNGSRHDSTTLKNLLDELEKLELQNICITLDKGYYSEKNIELIRHKGHDFIIPIPKRVLWQYDIIDSMRDELYTLSARTEIEDHEGNPQVIQCLSKPIIKNGHRYYIHVVYNPAIRADAEKGFIELLAGCKKELEEKVYLESHKDLYDMFFDVRDTPKRGRKVTEKISYASEFQKNYAGYWCLLTNRKKPKDEIYSAYQQRNTAEIFYDTFKNDLNGDRITDHKLESYEGKMFILFIALAILTRLKRKLAQKRNGNRTLGRLKTYSQLLFRISTLAKVSFKGKYKPIYSTPTKLQKEIINNFDLKWPGLT